MMVRGLFSLLLIGLGMLPGLAQAKPLVADLSQHVIAIDSGFTGTEILFFGARNDSGDVVVVIRGPEADFTVRRKERVGGIWVNTEERTYSDLPYFYAIASTRPMSLMENTHLRQQLGIGEDLMVEKAANEPLVEDDPFMEALMSERRGRGLFTPVPRSVGFMGETLFKTVIPFPDHIPRGDYTAEVYLLRDGRLVGMQSTPLQVTKKGFDAFMYQLAHKLPLLYGLLGIVVALTAGWGAGAIFRRI